MPRCSCSSSTRCACVVEGDTDNDCIEVLVEGNGTLATPFHVSATPIISEEPGNLLDCLADGLYAGSDGDVDGHLIKDEGTPLTQRAGLNFIGDSVVATDDAGGNETEVAINHPATGVHSVAQPLTVRKNTGADVGTRPRMNLIEGTNITLTVADDPGSNEVDVTINAAGDAVDSITVRKNTGADVGTRPRVNLIEGPNITLTVADDAGSNEVDVTIEAAGGASILVQDAPPGGPVLYDLWIDSDEVCPVSSGFSIINTDGDLGKQVYVGSIDPDVSYTPVIGDVWIETV